MADVWGSYKARVGTMGATRRDRAIKNAQHYLYRKLPASPSWSEVTIDGIRQAVSITDQKDNMAKKKICSMPGEKLKHGGLVDFANSKWIITETDANDEVYAKGVMQRCNYLLKWLDENGVVIEKWSIVEDGTKYLIGEKAEDMMAIGDARVAVTIAKDDDTVKLKRGKRFLIDDVDSESVLAFQITKPNKLYNVYDGDGVYRFILNEVELTDNDNTDLRIADYYSWKPKIPKDNDHKNPDISLGEIIDDARKKAEEDDDNNKEVWL